MLCTAMAGHGRIRQGTCVFGFLLVSEGLPLLRRYIFADIIVVQEADQIFEDRKLLQVCIAGPEEAADCLPSMISSKRPGSCQSCIGDR